MCQLEKGNPFLPLSVHLHSLKGPTWSVDYSGAFVLSKKKKKKDTEVIHHSMLLRAESSDF